MPLSSHVRHTIPEFRVGSDTELSEHLSRTDFPFALAVSFEDNDEHLEYEAMLD
jgi:hypothetical protein